MGYAATTKVYYGVELTTEQAQRLEQYIEGLIIGTSSSADNYHDYLIDYLVSEDDKSDRRLYASLITDGTDSRIHNVFDPEVSDTHIFGIYVAGNGYACSDNIAKAIKNLPEKAKENYVKYLLPILTLLKIDIEPDTHVITTTD